MRAERGAGLDVLPQLHSPGELEGEDPSPDHALLHRPPTPVGRKRGRVEPCGFEVVPIENPGEWGAPFGPMCAQ